MSFNITNSCIYIVKIPEPLRMNIIRIMTTVYESIIEKKYFFSKLQGIAPTLIIYVIIN